MYLKELSLLVLIILIATLSDVDCLIHSSGEVHQSISCLASCQSLVGACQPGRVGTK